NGCSKIHVPPFRMTRRFPKSVPLAEESFGEPPYPAIAVAALLPVEDREHCGDREGVGRLGFRDQARILLVSELTQRVVVGKRLGEGDRHEVEPRTRRDLGEEIDRLANYAH